MKQIEVDKLKALAIIDEIENINLQALLEISGIETESSDKRKLLDAMYNYAFGIKQSEVINRKDFKR